MLCTVKVYFYIVVPLFVAALGGWHVFHVVIIVFLGFGFSPERLARVVSDGSRVISFTRRTGGCMRRTHVESLAFKKSRWREERFEDAIEWAMGVR